MYNNNNMYTYKERVTLCGGGDGGVHIILYYIVYRLARGDDDATRSIGQGIINVGEEGVSHPIVRNGSPLPIYVYKYKYNTHVINTRTYRYNMYRRVRYLHEHNI